MRSIKLAQENVEPAVYQEDIVGYVFMFLLVGSVITAYFFWYFVARDTYPGASDPKTGRTKAPESDVSVDTEL